MHFTLCDLVTDITQNAAESGASLVELDVRETAGEFRFTVRDNGKGMDQDEIEWAKDPFITDGIKHPHRKVGLGIPFLIQTALQSGGGWDLQSQKHRGTTVSAWFDMANVDTPPVGELPGMVRTVLLLAGPAEIQVFRSLKNGVRNVQYEVCKSELIKALGDLEDVASLVLLDQYLHSIEEDDPEEDESQKDGEEET
ncbi:MAG: ATP-binding protein [Spirochaetaceae bacterium]|nr:ATP-binding protein [Spirochaetaceae bacterium]